MFIDHATSDRKALIASTYRSLVYKTTYKAYWLRCIGAVILGIGIAFIIAPFFFMLLGASSYNFYIYGDIDFMACAFFCILPALLVCPGQWLLEGYTGWQ